jgi:hypothetical protein
MTFQEHFCAQNSIPAADFESALLDFTLFPAARLLRPLLSLASGFFEDEVRFVRQVGAITRLDDYLACEAEYIESDGYRSFLHQRLRWRISRRRMRMAIRSFRPPVEPGSAG